MKGLLGRQSTFVRNSVRDVEDMAEISMERHRAHVERNREAAAQRLSIRILERKGEMDPSRAQAQRKWFSASMTAGSSSLWRQVWKRILEKPSSGTPSHGLCGKGASRVVCFVWQLGM